MPDPLPLVLALLAAVSLFTAANVGLYLSTKRERKGAQHARFWAERYSDAAAAHAVKAEVHAARAGRTAHEQAATPVELRPTPRPQLPDAAGGPIGGADENRAG